MTNTNTLKIARYQLRDVARSKWTFLYAGFFLLVTDALFRFGGTGDQVLVSLLNVVLLVVPLIAAVLGAIYLYGSREYVELLLAHPVKRTSLFRGLFLGLAIPLVGGFVLGVGLPFFYHGGVAATGWAAVGLLLLTGALLTVVFIALSFGIALLTDDRVRGLGAALVVWLGLGVVWDGMILMVIHLFQGFPLEYPVLTLSLMNPVDLGRILLLLQADVSALMGATGAVFQRFFGSTLGQTIAVTALFAWLVVPLCAAERIFMRKNF